MLALPALLVCGLLRHSSKYFRLPAGFYGLKTIFLLLAFMALARLKSIEALRYYAPGEWGKLLGLDRAPEVRTLRVKVKTLADQNQAFSWSSKLCKEWMAEAPQEAAVLYVDGHVRVYYGNTKQLPKHYIARERLCLSATADYWVNAMDGKPFFVVSQAVDPGLLQVLECDIVPRLENDMPNQPSSHQIEADPLLHRFTVVFDREGYSPNFFVKMKNRRIACLTYRKYPGEDWPQQEFFPTDVRLSSGQFTTIRLAERGTWLGDRLWVREIRKLNREWPPNCSALHRLQILGGALGLRPCLPDGRRKTSSDICAKATIWMVLLTMVPTLFLTPTMVVNPAYRALDGQARKKIGVLNRKIAEFGAVNLEGEIEPCEVEAFTQRKSDLQDSIASLQKEIDELKALRKATKRHIPYKELPPEARFDRLSTQSKHFIDIIKMIAYRAETAMAQILRQNMTRHDDARSLLRAIYSTEVDIVPDPQANTLTIRLHPLANTSSDLAVRHLCAELNTTETLFPGTELRLIYDLVSSKNL